MVYTDGQSLVADTLEELNAFAPKAGVFTFYDHRRRPHFVVDKTSLPTVMAHGAKRVSTNELIRKSNAMAKKRDHWYLDASDAQIREKIEKFAPWKRGESIFYEGQNFSQGEMFDIMFHMFKDMQQDPNNAEAIAKKYKLPKVLPLSPRQDPPTDREILADLHNKIEYGRGVLVQEEGKEEKDQEYINTVKTRLAELQKEYDPLEIKVQEEAIAMILEAVTKAQGEVDALGKLDVSIQEHRDAISKLSSLKKQHEALQVRMGEIYLEQAKRKQGEPEPVEVTEEMVTEIRKKLDTLTELLPVIKQLSDAAAYEKQIQELEDMKALHETLLKRLKSMLPINDEVNYSKDNPSLTDASDKSKYPDLGVGYDHEIPDSQRETVYQKLQDQTPVFSCEELADMETQVRKEVTKAAVELSLDIFLEMYPQYTAEDYRRFNESVTGASLYKVVYDPASPKDGESNADVHVEKIWPNKEAMKNLNDPHFGEKERREQDNNFNLFKYDPANDTGNSIYPPEVRKAAVEFDLQRFIETYPQYSKEDYFSINRSFTGGSPGSWPMPSANDAKIPIRIPTDDTLPPPASPEMLKDIDPLPPQPKQPWQSNNDN